MFEKVTKYFASKATDGAIDGVKESLNDKIDKYGDILNFGLVLSVIIIGGHFITRQPKTRRHHEYQSDFYIPDCNPGNTPIVINNYYHDNTRREEKQRHYGEKRYIEEPRQRTARPAYKKH